jgi:hypothetical protein
MPPAWGRYFSATRQGPRTAATSCVPDPDAPTVDDLAESIADVIDTVPDKSRGKHDAQCWQKHAPCLAEKIRKLLP